MVEVYPLAPLSRNLTINVAVMSYCGELYFGIVGDGAAAPDLETLAGGIEDAFAELHTLALGQPEGPSYGKVRPQRRTAAAQVSCAAVSRGPSGPARSAESGGA